jgi:hypothetical protein
MSEGLVRLADSNLDSFNIELNKDVQNKGLEAFKILLQNSNPSYVASKTEIIVDRWGSTCYIDTITLHVENFLT